MFSLLDFGQVTEVICHLSNSNSVIFFWSTELALSKFLWCYLWMNPKADSMSDNVSWLKRKNNFQCHQALWVIKNFTCIKVPILFTLKNLRFYHENYLNVLPVLDEQWLWSTKIVILLENALIIPMNKYVFTFSKLWQVIRMHIVIQ